MLFAVIAALVCQAPPAEEASTLLTIEVSEFQNMSGNANLAVFSSGDAFPMELEEAVFTEVKPVDSSVMVFTVTELGPGSYAVYVFHDEDSDGELDMHWYGPPSERVGVSNDATGFAGPPDFDDAAFDLEEESYRLIITLQ